MQQLPIFLSLAGRAVIIIGDGEAAAAKARLVAAAGGSVVGEDVTPTAGTPALAFVALDDLAAAQAAADRLRARGLLVNVVDRPALSDFLMGAIIDRSPVVIAISTGGASASLSRALRGRLEGLLPQSLGPLAKAIEAARAAASARHPTIAARRRLWEQALATGASLDPLVPIDDAMAAVAAVIDGTIVSADRIVTITISSADPGDLTLNQLALLGRCDNLLVTGKVPAAIVDRARRDAIRIDKLPQPPPAGLTVILQA